MMNDAQPLRDQSEREPYVGENTDSYYTQCIKLAKREMDANHPAQAEKWFRAAEAAARAAQALMWPAASAPVSIFQGGNNVATDCLCPREGYICNNSACPRAIRWTV